MFIVELMEVYRRLSRLMGHPPAVTSWRNYTCLPALAQVRDVTPAPDPDFNLVHLFQAAYYLHLKTRWRLPRVSFSLLFSFFMARNNMCILDGSELDGVRRKSCMSASLAQPLLQEWPLRCGWAEPNLWCECTYVCVCSIGV